MTTDGGVEYTVPEEENEFAEMVGTVDWDRSTLTDVIIRLERERADLERQLERERDEAATLVANQRRRIRAAEAKIDEALKAEGRSEDLSVIHDDLFELLRALRLGDHARPISAHDVMQLEVLPRIREWRDRVALIDPGSSPTIPLL